MEQIIVSALNNFECISQIQNISLNKMYSDKIYIYLYKFIYRINNIEIPMIMGIPIDWDRKLIDIYIEKYREFKYIPHLDSKGKICLFDLEGVLIDKNFEGLINQTLQRVNKVLWDGLNELNKEDFIEEFEQYWGRLPNTKTLKSMIIPSEDIKIIKYANNQKKVKREKGDNYLDIKRKSNQYSIVCSDFEKDFSVYQDMKNVRNGVYIHIKTDVFIYPPDWRKDLDIEYINNLLGYKDLEKKDLISKFNKCSGDLLLIFNIEQPSGYMNIFGVIVKGYNLDIQSMKLKILTNTELIPCWVTRCDKEYLIDRGGAHSHISNKRILVIGCGSIGGYLVNELVKTGINNITVVDGDLLKEENIYRHLLGMQYIKNYKAVAIAEHFKKNIPSINIVSYPDDIEDIINDGEISLSEYDLIISAVGNHNLNRWINEYVHTSEMVAPVVYLWNEVLGIGNHVAFISNNYKGCYECFFGDSEEGIYDRTSFSARGQSFTKKIRGCGSSYLPFSSSNSMTTVITGIEVIRSYFEGRIIDNFLVSVKGDNYYFENAGLKTSDRYNSQPEIKQKIDGEKFMKENCLICGDK